MLSITKESFTKEVEECAGLVIIDLYADWCAPCKMLSPILSELEDELSEVKFCKINVDEEPELASLFKVTSIPMIAAVKDNTFLDLRVGYTEKEELRNFILEYK